MRSWCFLAAAFLIAVSVQGEDLPPGLVEKQVLSLGRIVREAHGAPVISPSGHRLAYRTYKVPPEKRQVYCNGAPGLGYDGVSGICFSPDGERLAYNATRGAMALMVCDEQELGILAGYFSFSPDSKHIAYAGRAFGDTATNYMMLDGKKAHDVPMAGYPVPVFSPDSRHLAHQAGSTPKRVVICDGKTSPEYDDVGRPVFLPNSKGLVYAACRRNVWSVIFGAKTLGPFDEVGDLVCCPDSQEVAFRARRGKKWFMACGKGTADLLDEVRDPLFSPAGDRLAFAGKEKGAWFVACDGRNGPAFEAVGSLAFSPPDGEHLAYGATRKGKALVVCDGREYGDYDAVLWVGFSPDGKHLACAVRRGTDEHLVCDGLEGPAHAGILVPEHFYDVPGKLRYVILEKGKEWPTKDAWLVEVDWPEGRTWEDAFKPAPAAK